MVVPYYLATCDQGAKYIFSCRTPSKATPKKSAKGKSKKSAERGTPTKAERKAKPEVLDEDEESDEDINESPKQRRTPKKPKYAEDSDVSDEVDYSPKRTPKKSASKSKAGKRGSSAADTPRSSGRRTTVTKYAELSDSGEDEDDFAPSPTKKAKKGGRRR